jgi:hypothetical protein|tara:strand:+ start:283 stop:549 length:267 start_codon:yes stop_codon:yes gene_type:complete
VNEKKNETKKSDTKRDSVSLEKGKASNQRATKKSDGQDNVVEKSKSEAGKGDKLRRGITQDEWGDKWEKIFKPQVSGSKTKNNTRKVK